MSKHHPHGRHHPHQEERETAGVEVNDDASESAPETRAPSDADRCPNCSAGTLRLSGRKLKDWPKALLGLKPYWCSCCHQWVYRR